MLPNPPPGTWQPMFLYVNVHVLLPPRTVLEARDQNFKPRLIFSETCKHVFDLFVEKTCPSQASS